MHAFPRSGLTATSLAVALALALSVGASAQVATLVSPDETPTPDGSVATEPELEFADREEALLAFAQCMRDNGVDMDDPTVGEGGGAGRLIRGGAGGGRRFDEFGEEFQIAQEACGAILEAARPDIDPEAEQERLEEELAFAQCFRDNGYPDYPDPIISADGRLQRGGQAFQDLGIDRRSEEFEATRASCAEQLGIEATGRGPGGLGGAGGAVPAGGE